MLIIIWPNFCWTFVINFYLQIRDFHIAKKEEDIGYYAGYVGEITFYT
jgi:hypothetical protein